MQLSDKDNEHFSMIHPKLVLFAAIQTGKTAKNMTLPEFALFPLEYKVAARNALYDNPKFFDDYINLHATTLSEEDKGIIRDFKNFERGRFHVISLTKKYAYFLGEKFVFGVLALNDSFDEVMPNRFPIMIETVLLPFKGQIVYDGIIQFYNVFFGSGIKKSVKNEFNKSKGQYGLITNLPVEESISTKKPDLTAKLSAMMKTKALRDYNWYDIQDLINNNPELLPHYYLEWGKINSRAKKKQLKQLGIKNYYFAIYHETIVCSAKTQKELDKQLKAMSLTKADLEAIYTFKM